MNVKAEKFQAFLTENDIKIFEVEELNDEANTVVFRSRMEVDGQRLPTVLIFDDSIYTLLRVAVAQKIIKDNNKDAIAQKINELNRDYKIVKYYVNLEGDIYLDCCVPSSSELFDHHIIRAVIDVTLQHLIANYPSLMRAIWSEAQ